MAKLHTNRQISVASVLLVLLAAFAVDPPEHRCRTQSTRNRAARTVRLDDHDGDHNRWHAHGFDNSPGDTQADSPVALSCAVLILGPPGFQTEGVVPVLALPEVSRFLVSRLRGRAPPSSSSSFFLV